MIRHMFISPLKEGVTQQQISQIIHDMNELPGKIPEIVHLSVGENLCLFGDKTAIASIADFKNEADWKTYMEHPDHMQLAKVALDIFDMANTSIAQIKKQEIKELL